MEYIMNTKKGTRKTTTLIFDTSIDERERILGKKNIKLELSISEEDLLEECTDSSDECSNIIITEQTKTDLKQLVDIQNTIMNFCGKEFDTVIDLKNKTVWFKGKDIAEYLLYKNTEKAIHRHVPEKDIIKYEKLIGDKQSKKDCLVGNQKNTKYINHKGVLRLATKSKLPKALEFQDWLHDEVLDKIMKYGSYSVQNNVSSDEIKTEDKYCTKNTITEYIGSPVLYIGYIGKHNNEHLYKYGLTNDTFERQKSHKETFGNFTFVHIVKCVNEKALELAFEKELKVRNIWRELKIGKKKQTELFTTTNKIKINDIKKLMDNVIEKHTSKNNEWEYKLLIEKEITKQKELEYKKVYEENRKLELDMKKMEMISNYNDKMKAIGYFNN
jgi:prophage antirepressor-like protein